eukprot:6177545-Pleurochrysis_carterae.AAC.1
MTAAGRAPRVSAPTASATAQAPNSSAAGIDRTGRVVPTGAARRSRTRSTAVAALMAAPLRSASRTSGGQASGTSHAVAVGSPGSCRKQ